MIDIDWFLKQSTDQIDSAEHVFDITPIDETTLRLHLFAAWANWRNILLMVKTGMVELTEGQQNEYDYIKLKFVQYANYLPKETSSLSI